MSTRAERRQILTTKIGSRLKGLRKDPCLSAHLDAMDQADAEGLNQMVEALIAEVNRSGHGGGFLLELRVAHSLFGVGAPRQIQCEQQGGKATAPGDIWLDAAGFHFEFQCKHLQNWSVELWMSEAIDAIERACADTEAGRFYDLNPTMNGSQQDWRDFADWVTNNQNQIADFATTTYRVADGTPICSITFKPAPSKGIRFRAAWSPGGVQTVPDDLVRKKLNDARKAAEHTLSAPPGSTQINCVVVAIENFLVEPEDVFHALYGRPVYRVDIQTHKGDWEFQWDGLWYTNKHWPATISALILVKTTQCEPLTTVGWVFPKPEAAEDVKAAFALVPGYQVVLDYGQVDRI